MMKQKDKGKRGIQYSICVKKELYEQKGRSPQMKEKFTHNFVYITIYDINNKS
jgi:hypothetical protein